MTATAVLALRWKTSRRVARALTVAGLAGAAAGALACACFATQTVAGKLPAGVARTSAGRLHDLGTLFILAGLALAALSSTRIVGKTSYRLLVLGMALAFFAAPALLVAAGIDAPGWGQRALIADGCVFLWRLIVVVTPAARTSSGGSIARAPKRSAAAASE